MVQDVNTTADYAEEDEPLYLSFHVQEEAYLVAVRSVAEVIGVPKLVPVPDVAPYLLGVINLRGQVVPILDLAIRFGMTPAERTSPPVIIVVIEGKEQLGLLVSGVRRVVAVSDEKVDRKPLADRRSTVIDGVATTDDGSYLIVDVSRLVADYRPNKESAA